jgi:hypothetical protein
MSLERAKGRSTTFKGEVRGFASGIPRVPASSVSVAGVGHSGYEAGTLSARVCARASRHQMTSYA